MSIGFAIRTVECTVARVVPPRRDRKLIYCRTALLRYRTHQWIVQAWRDGPKRKAIFTVLSYSRNPYQGEIMRRSLKGFLFLVRVYYNSLGHEEAVCNDSSHQDML
jgi:hypothetical protein